MKIRLVTMTGADSKVKYKDLLKLSKEFPFVEWGILLSKSKAGEPRYPKASWLANLRRFLKRNDMNVSGHLCGRWTRDLVLEGKFTFASDPETDQLWRMFDRIQINYSSYCDRIDKTQLTEAILPYNDETEYIFQIGKQENGVFMAALLSGVNCSALFDKSGGRGLTPGEWPERKPFGGRYGRVGYAGGLGPDNLADELKKIEDVVGEGTVWIDMEGNIRTDEKFDLKKVRKCLEIAAPYVESQ